MAFPTELFVKGEDGSVTLISTALGVSRKRVLYSENAYRDTFNAAFMGGEIPNGGSISGAVLWGSGTEALVTGVSPTSTTASTSSLSDEISHMPWRIKQYVRWMLEFWDAATVGKAMTVSVTTVSGSATITVSDGQLFTPGQGISGLGIPAGTIVLDVLPIPPVATAGTFQLPSLTTVILSQQSTASATVAATLTGANPLGSFYEDEIVSWGGEVSFPT